MGTPAFCEAPSLVQSGYYTRRCVFKVFQKGVGKGQENRACEGMVKARVTTIVMLFVA